MSRTLSVHEGALTCTAHGEQVAEPRISTSPEGLTLTEWHWIKIFNLAMGKPGQGYGMIGLPPVSQGIKLKLKFRLRGAGFKAQGHINSHALSCCLPVAPDVPTTEIGCIGPWALQNAWVCWKVATCSLPSNTRL